MTVRHSREDALNEREFAILVDALDDVDADYRAECRWILYAAGRLGLRAGEISHARREWIDWERDQIQIPSHSECSCGYCRKRAEETAEALDDVSFEEAMADRWNPKTSNSVRTVPFGFDEDVKAAVCAFWIDRDEYSHSRVSVNRRVDRLLDASPYSREKTYPHALRATAACHYAYQGVPPVALQGMFGWADLTTAQKYVRASGGATAAALNDAHGD